jgi:hypothetical protein
VVAIKNVSITKEVISVAMMVSPQISMLAGNVKILMNARMIHMIVTQNSKFVLTLQVVLHAVVNQGMWIMVTVVNQKQQLPQLPQPLQQLPLPPNQPPKKTLPNKSLPKSNQPLPQLPLPPNQQPRVAPTVSNTKTVNARILTNV